MIPVSKKIYIYIVFSIASMLVVLPALAGELNDYDKQVDQLVDDRPVPNQVVIPAWFKNSFLNLKDDMEEAKQAKKIGLAVYFGQKDCAYCKALMEINLKIPDIKNTMQKNFDVIPIDIWNSRQVNDIEGVGLTEREYSIREKTNFTPPRWSFSISRVRKSFVLIRWPACTAYRA